MAALRAPAPSEQESVGQLVARLGADVGRIVRGVIGERPVAFAAVDPSSTAQILGKAVPGRAMQVCVPDRNGRFPWDAGCDPMVRDPQRAFLDLIDMPVAEVATAPRLH